METARAALISLTVGDSVTVEGRVCVRAPLLEMLREAIGSSTGGAGSSGSGGERSLVNASAADLYDHIDGWVRACLNEWGIDHSGELKTAMKRLFDAIPTQHWMEPDDAQRVYARFGEWAQKILEMFDPPKVMEFRGECPQCEQTHHVSGDVSNYALAATVRPGQAIIVECRACGALWVGKDQLAVLAGCIGANINWEAVGDLVGA